MIIHFLEFLNPINSQDTFQIPFNWIQQQKSKQTLNQLDTLFGLEKFMKQLNRILNEQKHTDGTFQSYLLQFNDIISDISLFEMDNVTNLIDVKQTKNYNQIIKISNEFIYAQKATEKILKKVTRTSLMSQVQQKLLPIIDQEFLVIIQFRKIQQILNKVKARDDDNNLTYMQELLCLEFNINLCIQNQNVLKILEIILANLRDDQLQLQKYFLILSNNLITFEDNNIFNLGVNIFIKVITLTQVKMEKLHYQIIHNFSFIKNKLNSHQIEIIYQWILQLFHQENQDKEIKLYGMKALYNFSLSLDLNEEILNFQHNIINSLKHHKYVCQFVIAQEFYLISSSQQFIQERIKNIELCFDSLSFHYQDNIYKLINIQLNLIELTFLIANENQELQFSIIEKYFHLKKSHTKLELYKELNKIYFSMYEKLTNLEALNQNLNYFVTYINICAKLLQNVQFLSSEQLKMQEFDLIKSLDLNQGYMIQQQKVFAQFNQTCTKFFNISIGFEEVCQILLKKHESINSQTQNIQNLSVKKFKSLEKQEYDNDFKVILPQSSISPNRTKFLVYLNQLTQLSCQLSKFYTKNMKNKSFVIKF